MSKHTWTKQNINGTFCLVPACRDAEEWLGKTKVGQGVLLDPRRPRNIQHHRKLFALLNVAVDNWPEPTTVEALLGAIKITTGHTLPIEVRSSFLFKFAPALWDMFPKGLRALLPGKFTVHMPQSINFESMSQDDFEPFYSQAVQIISTVLGVDVETLETEARAA